MPENSMVRETQTMAPLLPKAMEQYRGKYFFGLTREKMFLRPKVL